MSLYQGFRVALKSLAANKLRSGLTMLGIVIGVAAVIAMLSIGRGAEAAITAQIESAGTNLLFIRPGNFQQGGGAFSAAGTAASLTLADSDALAKASMVIGVAPEVNGRAQVVFLSENTNTRVVGVTPEYLWVRNFEMADGDFISRANVTARSAVVVLGSTVADVLFGGTAGAVGQSIRMNAQPYRVIGVLVSKGGSGFGNQDDQVLLPLTTAQSRLLGARRFGDSTSINVINAQVANVEFVDQAIEEISAILLDRHHLLPGEEDFSVLSQQDILGAATQITDVFTLFLGGIAGISLVVGGIGIMNIMLVTVTERTREIGIRKAVGARRQDILFQFLVEAAVLSVLGGLIGIFLGWLISRVISGIPLGGGEISAVVELDIVLLATLFSMAMGLFFGIYPASRAAALEPVEALRTE